MKYKTGKHNAGPEVKRSIEILERCKGHPTSDEFISADEAFNYWVDKLPEAEQAAYLERYSRIQANFPSVAAEINDYNRRAGGNVLTHFREKGIVARLFSRDFNFGKSGKFDGDKRKFGLVAERIARISPA